MRRATHRSWWPAPRNSMRPLLTSVGHRGSPNTPTRYCANSGSVRRNCSTSSLTVRSPDWGPITRDCTHGREPAQNRNPERNLDEAPDLAPHSAPFDQNLAQAFRAAYHHVVAGVDGDHVLHAAERSDAGLL